MARKILQDRDIYLDDSGDMIRVNLIIRCGCGCKIEFEGGDEDCPRCHTSYNAFGQELAPREQWGCETGESLADILCGAEA